MSQRRGYEYSPLHPGPALHARHLSYVSMRGIFFALGGLMMIVVSFVLGRFSQTSPNNMLSLDRSPHIFIYNRTFAEDSVAADQAWNKLFPKWNGYFTHPEIAPKRATFSVYHYLHCLENGIRNGYWAVHAAALAGEKLDDKTLPKMISPPHIRHCIDLLRQSLMCNPDLTVEVKDEAAGGVHGFGETHQCINWRDLMDWTKRWESKQS